jgi:hypothetical protein
MQTNASPARLGTGFAKNHTLVGELAEVRADAAYDYRR